MGDQQLANPGEFAKRLLRAFVAHQSSGRVQNLRPATERREPEEELVLGGAKWRSREQLLEGDEIASGEGAAYAGFDRGRQPERIHDALEELRVSDVDLVAAQPGGFEATRGERDHLSVGDRSRRPHEPR